MKRPDRFSQVLVERVDSDSQELRLSQVTVKPVRSGVGEARLASLRQLQSAMGEELRLRTLLPSVLDRAFKGEL